MEQLASNRSLTRRKTLMRLATLALLLPSRQIARAFSQSRETKYNGPVAPAGTPQYPTLLSNYVVRPPWNAAGVDYYVGVPSNLTLTSITSSQPTGTSLSGNVLTVNENNVTINGYDFTVAAGGTQAVFTGSISGTTLTVTTVTSGSVLSFGIIIGTGIASGTRILQQLTSNSGTSGGNPIPNQLGTYEVSISQTIASTTITEEVTGIVVYCGSSSVSNLTITNCKFGGSYYLGCSNLAIVNYHGTNFTCRNCTLDCGITLFQQNSSGPYSSIISAFSLWNDTETIVLEYNWFLNSPCQYLDATTCSVSLSYKYNLLDQCWPGVTGIKNFHQNSMQWGGTSLNNANFSFNTIYQASPAGGQGPQFGGAELQTMTINSPTATNNVIVTSGGSGVAMSFIFITEKNSSVTDGTVGYNYFDVTGAYGPWYGATMKSRNGWTNQLGNNFNMVTGALYNP